MKVKQRLQINVALSALTACIIIPMLILAMYRVNKAVEAQRVASDIISGAFERVALRNDYVRNNNERARIQWFAKHEQISHLLKSAAQVFGGSEDRVLLSELGKKHESLFNLFSGIVENREKTSLGAYSPALSQEIENRFISQLNIKVYDTVLLAGRLHESADSRLVSTIKFYGWWIITLIGILAATTIGNSRSMGRTIADRIERLRNGASFIGEGNLEHRIDIKGDDEFAELSRSFNTMTNKLRGSHADLEKEIKKRRKTNEALQRTTTLLDETQAIARVGGWEIDLIENTLYWTEETYRIHETLPSEYVPTVETAIAFYAPESVPVISSAVKEAIEQGKDFSLELQLITAKGRLIWVEAVGKGIRKDNRVVKVIGAFRDITERKQAEAIRLANVYNRSLLEASLDLLVTISADGKITDVNAATEKVTGRSREELIGTDFSDYFTEPEKAQAGYSKVFRESAVKDYALELRHKDGHLTPVLYNAAVYRDEAGNVIGVFAAARDITERRRAEKIAKLDEARTDSILRISQFPASSLRELLDYALDEAIVLSESKFGYLYFYHEDTQDFILHSWSKDVMAECTIANPQTDYKLEKTGIWGEVVRQRKPIIVNDFPAPHPLKKGYPEGHASLLRFFSVPVFSEGRIVAVTGFANKHIEYTDRDVSQMSLLMDSVWKIVERKQAEEEIKKLNQDLEARVAKRTTELEIINKELEAFAYSVSHDLRTPLRSIEGFSLALLEDYADRLDDTGKNYLTRVRNATMRMGHLIDDLLKLSRLSRNEMKRERIDLNAIGKDVAERLVQSHPERAAEFVIANGLTAYGDARLLTVALDNLFSNAWKFSEKNTRSVIEFGVIQRDNAEVFYVKDNGVGFDMAYAGKLFSPFQRLHSIDEFAGTGVGLATVKRVINRHGGRVWIESEVNKGTTVYFTLQNN